MAWFQIPEATPYVGGICCGVSLLLEVFSLVVGCPPPPPPTTLLTEVLSRHGSNYLQSRSCNRHLRS